MTTDFIPQDTVHRETTGERLVRIETLMTTVLQSLQAHIRDEEGELLEMKQALKEHIAGTSSISGDVRQLSTDVKQMKEKVELLEKEVRVLSESKSKVVAWAAGVSATVSALWIAAGDHFTKWFGG